MEKAEEQSTAEVPMMTRVGVTEAEQPQDM